ncbi:MAG: hypothetical protein JOZ27_02915, partial [Caulobacteraceae bacterium]|nr:hypothetical protein [Caulobacteraceae bacterium]
MSIDRAALDDLPAEDLADIAPRVRNGDLLLCSANDTFSRLIGWSTKSPWTHVAFAWRWDEVDRIVALECVQHIGVHAVGLERFISQTSSGTHPYPGKIILARHDDVETVSDLMPMMDFGVDAMGDRFSPGEIVKIASRITFGRFERHTPKPLKARDEFICSEYVDRCFQKVGIKFEWDGLGFIAPSDVANDPKVRAMARFR